MSFMFLKKAPEPVVEASAVKEPEPVKIIESEELLRELEEKYNRTQQYFLTDRFQSYTEASNQLEEILSTYQTTRRRIRDWRKPSFLSLMGIWIAREKIVFIN
ncbi:MAG: hypothetical protein R2877_00755 [Bdellovibrionota bacterium]